MYASTLSTADEKLIPEIFLKKMGSVTHYLKSLTLPMLSYFSGSNFVSFHPFNVPFNINTCTNIFTIFLFSVFFTVFFFIFFYFFLFFLLHLFYYHLLISFFSYTVFLLLPSFLLSTIAQFSFYQKK